jgi:hypothetical protein
MHFEQSNREVLLVTDAWSTNRWAFEYRSGDLPNGASYVLNTKQDGYYDTRISDLQLLHNSESAVAQAAPWGNMEHYTIVYQHVRVQKSKIGFRGNWLLRFQTSLPSMDSELTLACSKHLENPLHFRSPCAHYRGLKWNHILEIPRGQQPCHGYTLDRLYICWRSTNLELFHTRLNPKGMRKVFLWRDLFPT